MVSVSKRAGPQAPLGGAVSLLLIWAKTFVKVSARKRPKIFLLFSPSPSPSLLRIRAVLMNHFSRSGTNWVTRTDPNKISQIRDFWWFRAPSRPDQLRKQGRKSQKISDLCELKSPCTIEHADFDGTIFRCQFFHLYPQKRWGKIVKNRPKVP